MTATDRPFVAPGVNLPDADPGNALQPADRTVKADVLAELKRDTRRPNITLAVPDRPGWSVEYDVDLNADLLKAWTNEATGPNLRGDLETDMFELALLTIAGQCKALHRGGEPLVIDGETITFTSTFMAETYGSMSTTETVRLFYGNDNVVAAVYERLQREAQAGSLDPTERSSD
jgi:hypothetical protein